MIFRWPTFSELTVAALALLALPASAASISGAFSLHDSRDLSVSKKRDFSGIAVWLEPINYDVPIPPARTYTIVQKEKRFSPHVLMIPVGASVDFPNLDPIFHNAFSNFAGQPFDTGLYPPGTSQKIRFIRTGVVRVFCNIHSTMSAVIVVVPTPWFAASSRDGSFRIDGVPAGDYRLKVWHERATSETLDKLVRTINVGAADLALPPAGISESGYVVLPHTNKHGDSYPPEPAADAQYLELGR